MTVLLLTLAGPMQAWGSTSRFTTRSTDDAPTKSGVVGLLAAARGLRRTDPVEDLARLRFGARVDQPGELLRDFQTARSLDGVRTMPLSYRYYRADARYVVGVEGDGALLAGLAEAIENPVFPLYLGRRSCPPSESLAPRQVQGRLEDALLGDDWRAAQWYQDKHGHDVFELEFRIDAEGAPARSEADPRLRVDGDLSAHDIPLSFDPEHRDYGWRTVRRGWLPRPGAPDRPGGPPTGHEPMGIL